jgi:hypothetical protein
MKRWISDFLVESELTLSPGEKKIEVCHPTGRYKVALSN